LHRLKPLAEGFELSQDAFAKVAYRESTGGIVCIMRQQGIGLDRLNPGHNPLLLLLESVEKPGNLGAMLRTADAAGIDGVIVCDPLTDIYNPNLIRSSLGCVFTVPVSVCSSQEALDFLKKRDITVYAAVLQTENSCYDADFSGPTAFAMGSEANGLTEFWRRNSVAEIKIPMLGKTDSLNVSTAAAVLLFESVRQRSLRGR
jgi:RNA methyltransferase, TrmH family